MITLKCPSCTYNGTRVLNSRPTDDGRSIRRRRECEECHFRFTTFERIEVTPLVVVKKDGVREQFNRDKILRGLVKACEKRPVSMEILEKTTSEIEKEVYSEGTSEVKSEIIGELVMKHLISIDEVAYVRFASVYRQFKDVTVFLEELKELIKEK